MKRSEFINTIAGIKAIDIPGLAKNSVINHHVDGMIYLCLKRTETHTVKIYIMDRSLNVNSGYLVHPHNHRYEFYSTVLHGSLHHIRFKESERHGSLWVKFRYDWKSKSIKRMGFTRLYVARDDFHSQGEEYGVSTNEFHTLKPMEKTIVGLSQHADTCDDAFLFLPDKNSFEKPKSRQPTPEEYLKKLRWVHQVLLTGVL